MRRCSLTSSVSWAMISWYLPSLRSKVSLSSSARRSACSARSRLAARSRRRISRACWNTTAWSIPRSADSGASSGRSPVGPRSGAVDGGRKGGRRGDAGGLLGPGRGSARHIHLECGEAICGGALATGRPRPISRALAPARHTSASVLPTSDPRSLPGREATPGCCVRSYPLLIGAIGLALCAVLYWWGWWNSWAETRIGAQQPGSSGRGPHVGSQNRLWRQLRIRAFQRSVSSGSSLLSVIPSFENRARPRAYPWISLSGFSFVPWAGTPSVDRSERWSEAATICRSLVWDTLRFGHFGRKRRSIR